MMLTNCCGFRKQDGQDFPNLDFSDNGPTTTQRLGQALQWLGGLCVVAGTTIQLTEGGLEYGNYSSNSALNADVYGWVQITRWFSTGSNAAGVAAFAVGTAMIWYGRNEQPGLVVEPIIVRSGDQYESGNGRTTSDDEMRFKTGSGTFPDLMTVKKR